MSIDYMCQTVYILQRCAKNFTAVKRSPQGAYPLLIGKERLSNLLLALSAGSPRFYNAHFQPVPESHL